MLPLLCGKIVSHFPGMKLLHSGIDLLVIELELNTLQLVEAKKFSVSWYVYTHESRMVLLASGMQCSIFSAYQVRGDMI